MDGIMDGWNREMDGWMELPSPFFFASGGACLHNGWRPVTVTVDTGEFSGQATAGGNVHV